MLLWLLRVAVRCLAECVRSSLRRELCLFPRCAFLPVRRKPSCCLCALVAVEVVEGCSGRAALVVVEVVVVVGEFLPVPVGVLVLQFVFQLQLPRAGVSVVPVPRVVVVWVLVVGLVFGVVVVVLVGRGRRGCSPAA